MERNMAKVSLILIALLLGTASFAQRAEKPEKRKKKDKAIVQSRDQAQGWYLPVHGEVTTAGKKAEGVTVRLFKENDEMGAFAVNKNGAFDLELDLDFVYTLIIEKPDHQSKTVSVDAHLPEGLVAYPAYECFVNLDPIDKIHGSDPFFLDFPSAIVRYDSEIGGYYHSEAYLQHISNKLRSVAQATY